MNWYNIWESTISGIIVVVFGGITGWLFYVIGIRGKEKAQLASQRKQEIYIPLKYELMNIANSSNDIWGKVNAPEIEKIVAKNDELVVSEDIYIKCNQLLKLIHEYHDISLYDVASKILHKRFEGKYIELYGGNTHTEYHDNYGEDVEIDVLDYEITGFYEVASEQKNIDNLFNLDVLYEEYCQDEGRVGPIEDYLSRLFGTVLPKGEKKYAGIKFDNLENKALSDRRISPAEYIARDFNFFKLFNDDNNVDNKKRLLIDIKELALNTFEDVQVKIRYIGNRYEKE